MAKKNQEKAEISFEEALAELEQIVETLEQGNIPLAESLKSFEKGMALATICTSCLTEAEKKIELLMVDKDGRMTLKPAKNIDDCGEEQDEF